LADTHAILPLTHCLEKALSNTLPARIQLLILTQHHTVETTQTTK